MANEGIAAKRRGSLRPFVVIKSEWCPIIKKEQWTSGKLAYLVGRLRRIGSDWGGTRLRGRETIENRGIGKSHGE